MYHKCYLSFMSFDFVPYVLLGFCAICDNNKFDLIVSQVFIKATTSLYLNKI